MSPKEIQKCKDLYQQHFHRAPSDEEILQLLNWLITLYKTVYLPVNKNEYE